MEKSEKKGGVSMFQRMASEYKNNPKILNEIIQSMAEKINELEIDLQIATTRANALQDAFDRCEAKANAYDRLMSGGRKTLKEWANILNRVVVVNGNGDIESFAGEPEIDLRYCFWYLDEDDDDYEDFRYFIPKECVDFTGDWKDSLTLPDGWEQ